MSDEFNLQRYVKYRRQPGKIITVSGGKGGTGKTNVAVNLAIALAQGQQQVVLMDADIGLANAEVIMGLKSKDTLQVVIEGRKKVSEILTGGPNGIKVVPGVSGLNHLANLTKEGQCNVRMAMEQLQARFDFVVIDTMAGIGAASVAFAVAADEVLLVTTPEPSAMVDAYAMIKMIHVLNAKAMVSMLVNMADDQHQALRTFNKLAAAAKKFLNLSVNYAGFVARDPNVREAVLRSYPFILLYPWSPASKGLKELACTLMDEPFERQTEIQPGFFRRFAQTLGIAQ